ncbi:MAG TPA: hypothetical protein PKI11_08645 [Candidatus Hydrogenedentes bacterium]|nr:hypothetical protein [Candidatus Hydrogenedentota bacterium]HNT87050.1 hypothetical protein [Candidatus Hydrogenedentota bacterium]
MKTYVITFDDGEVVHGTYQEAGEQVTVTVDAPWIETPPVRRTLKSKVKDYRLELRHRREERHEREAREAGFQRVRNEAGEFYVRTEEVELAQRAREMAAQVEARFAPDAADVPIARPGESGLNDGAGGGVAAEDIGLLQRYGWQAVILLAGLGFTAVVLWLTFLAGKS